jgi:hypothetical protein
MPLESLSFKSELRDLEFGALHRFRDWRVTSVPAFGAGVYTIWHDQVLVYVGMSGRSIEAGTAASDRPLGLFTRLKSHADGRRSGDQFCVYVGDRLVLPTLTETQIADIAAGRVSLDRLIRDFIHNNLAYRFVILPSGIEARALEMLIRSGALHAGMPLLNPASVRRQAQDARSLGKAGSARLPEQTVPEE